MAPKRTQQNQNPTPLDAKALLSWYDDAARALPWRISPADRRTGVRPDPYRVWLSEIMLQQTTVVTVGAYFDKFTKAWPTVEALAAASLDEVLAAWAGLGYYARARNLHACAQKVAAQLDGIFPETAEALMQLPGIGPYTSAAVAAICYDEKVAVVDGNVDRVLARYLALPVPVRDAKASVRAHVQQAVPSRAGDFAQALMDLGATLCAPRATSCKPCPLHKGCVGAAAGNPTDFPIKPAKPQRPVRYGHAYILTRPDGAVWLRQRGDKGLLAKMSEVPGSDWLDAGAPPQLPLSADWRSCGHVTHVFTHFRLELDVWQTGVGGDCDLGHGWWSAPGQLAGEALPSLYRKVLAVAEVEEEPRKNRRPVGRPAVKLPV